MSILGYVIAFVIGFVIVLLLGYFKHKAFGTSVLVAALLGGGSAALAYHIEHTISGDIKEREMIAVREAAVVKKLEFIREAEKAYLEVHGNYTDNWDTLINFIKHGEFPIIERKETVVTLSYGADSSIVTYDTLGMISARDRIFNVTYNVNAANNGIFQEFKVKEGDKAQKGQPAYVIEQNGRDVTHKFREKGKVITIVPKATGAEVTKGELLMTLQDQQFDPKINIDRLAYVPGYTDVKFEIFAAEVEKSNIVLDVIEVKNPKPFDPARSDKNDSKNRKPLRFGSKTDVTTSGNWE